MACAATNVWIAGNAAGANADDVSHRSSESLSHVTASPPCPASMIALRAFSDRLTTRAPCVTSQLIGEGGNEQPACAVASSGNRRAVADRRRLVVLRARDLFPAVAIPPRVLDDPVRPWIRAGGHGGVARAGDCRQIRVGRTAEPGAVAGPSASVRRSSPPGIDPRSRPASDPRQSARRASATETGQRRWTDSGSL